MGQKRPERPQEILRSAEKFRKAEKSVKRPTQALTGLQRPKEAPIDIERVRKVHASQTKLERSDEDHQGSEMFTKAFIIPKNPTEAQRVLEMPKDV